MAEYRFTDEQNQLRDAVRKFSADHFAEDEDPAADGVRPAVRPEGLGAARRRARRARPVRTRSRRRRRRHSGRPSRRHRGARRAVGVRTTFRHGLPRDPRTGRCFVRPCA